MGRKMCIPKSEECVGFVGDNRTEVREFEIIDKALFDFNFKLDLKVKEHIGIVDLEKIVESDRVILRWEIKKEHLPMSGMLFAQLRAFNENGDSWHSEREHFWVSGGINATKHFPSPLPSEFEQIEQQVTTAKNETVVAKGVVLKKANEVTENAQIVSDKTEVVMQKAGEVEANTETVSENTDSAIDSANIAAQALADLLAMLGTDIATLTDGKLTPTQIPALSINDVFEVEGTEGMLSLTAERGDVALIIPEDVVIDSYILSTDNPTQINDWKKLGVSYVANAGHAVTADEATNATMINGHRQVRMTQEQYDIAYESGTLDDNTDYWVGG